MSSLAIGIALWTAPFVIALSFTYVCRDRHPGLHLLIWLVGIPVMYLLVPFLVLLVSFQVFGVDLVD